MKAPSTIQVLLVLIVCLAGLGRLDAGEQSRAEHRRSKPLQKLPDDQREAFLLKEESGLSLEEIATVTGVGRETVKSRLRYALTKLRQCLPQPETAGVEDD